MEPITVALFDNITAMSTIALEKEDHDRDAAFNKALHGKSAQEQSGLLAMMNKDQKAQKVAIDEYFKHWDNKGALDETASTREVSSIYNLSVLPFLLYSFYIC